jgi:uracil-DNA glycosylase
MPWTERQHAMLRGLGLRLWSAPAVATMPAVDVDTAEPVAPPLPAAAALALAQEAAQDTARETVHETAPQPARRAAASSAAPGIVVAPPSAAQPRSGLAALDWSDLRAAVAACRACALGAGRTQTVFGVGHPQAQWLLVGEAPGEQEDLKGEPFVGAAGQLLDRMLAALGLTRAEEGPETPAQRVYIANTLKCRPPRNRNPAPDEMARCEPFLQRQIELLQPRLILAMGRFAVQSLLRSDEPIGKLRGRVHRYQGRPLVVTYHPAYLLRSPADKARAWEDLCLAARVFEQGDHGGQDVAP